jgi:hypothetical protein
MFSVTRQIVSTTTVAITVTLLLTKIGLAQRPGLPSLVVTPSTSIAFSGPPGGPFSPRSVEYRVSASSGSVRYSVRTPSWLTASSTLGVTDTAGVTVTLTVNTGASSLPPGAYGPGVAFTNVSNGQGSVTRPAKLIIQAQSSPRPTPQIAPAQSSPRPTPQIAPDRGGFLLDSRGGHLLDEQDNRLVAQ